LRRIADAIGDGTGKSWSVGVIAGTPKRLKAEIDPLLMTDDELHDICASFQWITADVSEVSRS
jgi:hypothetical protein